MDGDSSKVEIHKLWIDIGSDSKEETLSRVSVGDPITFAVGMEYLTDKLAASRAFDDKMGTYILVETLRLLQGKSIKAGLFAVATTQEEEGWRGAQVSSYHLNPQIAIAIDVGHATDYPDSDQKKVGDFKLGGGPIITRGPNINPRVEKLLVKVAKEQGIPVQIEAGPGSTGTDAHTMQVARSGIATAVISVPLRYMHTPNEILALSDLQSTANLLAAFIEALDPSMNWIP
jgi:endoglucanase